jgi:hypothetical protein
MDPIGATDHTKQATHGSIRSFYRAMRERRWNHERSRRIAKMLKRESATHAARAEWLEGMALQLAEIRTLPEAAEPQL